MDVFEQSSLMIDELNRELDQSIFMDGGLRLNLVYKCCDLSIEHGIAVKALLKTELFTSALALFRIQFESVVRAYWLLMLASNQEVLNIQISTIDDLFKNKKLPMVSEMIEKLAHVKEIEHIAEQFKAFKFYSLNHLNSIVHTGGHSFIRNSVGLDQSQYFTVVKQTNNFTTMAAQILLRHAGKEKFIHQLHAKYRSCFQMEDDISAIEKARIDALYL